jgi:hypothetical protein
MNFTENKNFTIYFIVILLIVIFFMTRENFRVKQRIRAPKYTCRNGTKPFNSKCYDTNGLPPYLHVNNNDKPCYANMPFVNGYCIGSNGSKFQPFKPFKPLTARYNEICPLGFEFINNGYSSSTCTSSDGKLSFPVQYNCSPSQIQDPKTKLCYNNVGDAIPTCDADYTLSGKYCVKNT